MEDPEALRFPIARVAPRGEDLLLPGACRGDVGGRLGPGYEDEIEAALQVVSLQGAPYRGGDLEGSLAERNGGKGDIGRGDEANSLVISHG